MHILQQVSRPMQSDDLPCTLATIQAAQDAALRELRDVADTIARQHGHDLGRWRDHEHGGEVAFCQSCWRSTSIDIVREPHLAGPALSDRCPPRIVRPDAFLASQHESVTR
jgi:hypothetical protein